MLKRLCTDVTIKLQRDELNHLAYHDQFDVCLLMIDIDHFKHINDTYGHPIGDEILKQVATAFSSVLREQDIIARFGGEEFVVMFRPDGEKNALDKADKVLKIVEALMPEGLKVTISIGVAQLSSNDKDFFMQLKKADYALYEAKENGRNRIESWKE